MKKGSGTRSGLLWEVERLLNETENLPQILLMENVPQVISADNIDDFHSWCSFLENKGYKCYTQILNAKDYGVAQNRERCFMVSILGDYNYKFPQPVPLDKTMFIDTGLEYPEIREFVKTFENVDWIKPKLTFRKVIEKYGYPFIGKEISNCIYGARKGSKTRLKRLQGAVTTGGGQQEIKI